MGTDAGLYSSAPLGQAERILSRLAVTIHLVLAALCSVPMVGLAAAPTPTQVEFFEKHIRPVLAGECYECHASTKKKGGLALDTRDGLLKGGESGPALVPSQPDSSLLWNLTGGEVFDRDATGIDDLPIPLSIGRIDRIVNA